MTRAGSFRATLLAIVAAAAVLPPGPAAGQQPAGPERPAASPTFSHAVHAGFDCTRCHANGRATVTTDRSWCAGCHHTGRAYERCSECHSSRSLAGTFHVRQPFTPSVAPPTTRVFTFRHDFHGSVACRECHAGPPGVEPRRACDDCHEPHHRAENDCALCHEPPPDAHTVDVHVSGCGGSGCHQGVAAGYGRMKWTRTFCIACHRDRQTHEEGRRCVQCHVIPRGEDAKAGGDP
ncbi:MAG TPA: hypothetical protein VKB18_07375 [Gemmatimonadota bacterium]|nr:hypothetical protein [Gemmatimonadota bacterium]